ncbi:hypothetical protein [Luteolibacter marinus]|uniref:hypothetical protein n=1 Tax=Luteolibacter marinus TaxID=2776705 RepID=UPI0018685860|nr:hypothetical protein [Luteolibacter marinus]
MKSPFHVLSLGLLSTCALLAGPTFEVKNEQGRALHIELLEVADDVVTFATTGEKGGKEHSLAIGKFDADSQAKILEEAKDLKPRPPKLDVTVSVSKKRDKKGYYMVDQTVSTKVSIRNLGMRDLPKSKGYMTYFGRDRSSPDEYKVMARKTFDCQIAARGLFEVAVAGFKTSFDSDKKGSGNIGGFQYDGYLLVLMDEAGNVLHAKTSDPALRSMLENEPAKAERLTKVDLNKVLNKELEPYE